MLERAWVRVETKAAEPVERGAAAVHQDQHAVGVVAQVVGKSGVGVFSVLWIFLVAMLAGLAAHALIYYPLLAWLVGKKSPKVYLGQGADAILTAVSCNSSLATVPVTLQCLHRMNVSPQSSRLAACVGTNLNNDGITLYEAMAALAREHKPKMIIAGGSAYPRIIDFAVFGEIAREVPESLVQGARYPQSMLGALDG